MDSSIVYSELFPGLRVRFTKSEGGRVLVYADAETPELSSCPKCGSSPVYKHGSREFEYADTQLAGIPAVLRVDRRRFRCGNCKSVITPELALIDDKRNATKRLVNYIEERCFTSTFNQLAKDTGLAINTVRAITQDHIARLESTVVFQTPRVLGINSMPIGPAAATVFVNMEMRTLTDIREFLSESVDAYFEAINDRTRIELIVAPPNCLELDRLVKILPETRVITDPFDFSQNADYGYSETMSNLAKAAAYIGQGYSFEIARARLLYGKLPRQAGSSVVILPGDKLQPVLLEYGSHISTLLEFAERGEFD